MNTKKEIAIFGPYPPPLGGISVHIQRIEKCLIDENIEYTIFDHYSNTGKNVIPTNKNFFRYLKFLFVKDYALFHFHQMFLYEYIFYFLFSKINPTPFIITIHGETLLNINKWKQKAVLFFLKNTHNIEILSVSKNIHHLLISNSIDAAYLPAYVPPVAINKKNIQKDSRILFLFSLWKFEKEIAESIYNIRLAFEFLKRKKDGFKMVFMIGDKESSDLIQLNKLISEYALKEDILLIYNKNLVDYMHNFRFVLKTNLIDGYGVSLQEAMDLGVPAIATNVCERPKGTIVFESNNLTDLIAKVSFVINENKETILQKREKLNYHLDLIKIYESYLKESSV